MATDTQDRADPEAPRRDPGAASLGSRLVRLERRWRTASRRYGKNRVAVAFRLLDIYWRRGFRPGQALALGLADPGISEETLAGCVTGQEQMALQNRVNPPGLTCLTEDKSVFYPLCEAIGIPVPKTFAIVARGAGWVRGGIPVSGRQEWLQQLSATLPDSFVAKPATGVYGEGVTAWTRIDDGVADHMGRRRSMADFYDALCSDARYDRFVIQERLQNHPDLTRLTECTALQTVRLVTLVDPDGRPRLVCGFWKLIIGSNVSDNFMHGTTGNLIASLALEGGVLGPAMAVSPDGLGYVGVRTHPVTGLPLPGFRLPDWEATLRLAVRCALLFLPLRTVGWDIALTPRGPVVVEGNRWWDPPYFLVLGPDVPALERDRVIAAPGLLRRLAQAGARR